VYIARLAPWGLLEVGNDDEFGHDDRRGGRRVD
jgi:hypothetical protein